MEAAQVLIQQLNDEGSELSCAAAREMFWLRTAIDHLRTECAMERAATVAERERSYHLMELLADANDAFDQVTGSERYLYDDEPWRAYRYDMPESSDSCERSEQVGGA
jgi:hypothetical protein